jgi:hypothetical protein
MKKRVMLLCLVFVFAAVFAACTVDVKSADPQVVSITVDGISKTEYVACDELDLDGAEVNALYDDGDIEIIPLTEDMLDESSFDMDKPGEQNVVVVYGNKTTSFKITVTDWVLQSIELASLPYVTEYIVGETVDTAGATILCKFEGDKTKTYKVTSDMLQAYDNSEVGTETVKFTYYGVTMSFDVDFVEKTPTAIKIVDSAENNYVYKGFGEKYDMTGMTVKITYDNAQMPEYNAVDIKDDVFVSIDDSFADTVTAVLIYYPSSYRTTYEYTYYGSSYVALGDTVVPNEELASNKLVRDGEEIVLDSIKSKSYGTVTSVVYNDDGTKTMTVDTAVSYSLSDVGVTVGKIIADTDYIGKYGGSAVYVKGGGVVEKIDNGTVTVRTFPTVAFTSNVKSRSFTEIEILDYPSPEKYFETTINDMIQGDNIDKTTGRVRVYFDDGTTQDFRMSDENNIRVVNAGADSVNASLDISEAGRHELWVIYGGVLTNRVSMYVNVERKYPVLLTVLANDVGGSTFYFGDTISIASMRYTVTFNNETTSDPEQITSEMLGDGCTLSCAAKSAAYTSSIFFKLPKKYAELVPDGQEEIKSSSLKFSVEPQPITGAAFVQKPSKVYVSSVGSISYENSVLNVYYRNNAYTAINDLSALTVIYKSVDSWDETDSYVPEENETGERIVVFTRSSDTSAVLPIDYVKKGNGYTAKLVYFDDYEERSPAVDFTYYFMESAYEVDSIKVLLLSSSGVKYYKDTYSQYEDWDFSGVQIEVNYKNTSMSERIDATPDMVYGGTTDALGSDIPVKFAYLGATDDSTFKISVVERKPTAITVEKRGKTVYVDTFSGGIDFSEYKIILSYNAGPDVPIDGLNNLKTTEQTAGWWYKMYNSQGENINMLYSQIGTVVFELYYSYPDQSSPDGYSYIHTPLYYDVKEAVDANAEAEELRYTVEVTENTYTVTGISYELNKEISGTLYNATSDGTADGRLNADTDRPAMFPNSSSGLPVLAETASGWEIMLSEYYGGSVHDKVLTVTYKDAEGVITEGLVKIRTDMLDYDKLDTSTGYRRVTITYKNLSVEVFVYVWRAELTDVEVFSTPLQNYIYTAIDSEANLVLDGGILRLTFTKFTSKGVFVGYMYKYVDMSGDDIVYSGFVKGLYSKEGEEIVITAVYKGYTDLAATYTITVYDKQDVTFSYTNTIFFYGNVSDAAYTAKQLIREFTLPSSIRLAYVETAAFITLADYAALSEDARKAYVPVTVSNSDKNFSTANDKKQYATSMFVKTEDIKYDNYIDPAAGVYYVKYGDIGYVSEDRFDTLDDDEKAKFTEITGYTDGGKTVEKMYYTTDATAKGEYILWYKQVIVDKLTESEYGALGAGEKADYEEMSDAYYILMRVVDDREESTRYYETANYAVQTYTIIPKVIDVSTVAYTDNARVLRVSTSYGDNLNGNPYAILYLLNATNLMSIYDGYKQSYMSDILITSPNTDYFEITVILNNGFTGTDEQENAVAEVMYRILYALTTEEFQTESGVTLTINYHYDGEAALFSKTAERKSEITANLKTYFNDGVNSFTQAEVDGNTYRVSYLIAYGETLTRNGVLQLLSGRLSIEGVYDTSGNLTGYTVKTGTLANSSYTIDLTSNEIKVN